MREFNLEPVLRAYAERVPVGPIVIAPDALSAAVEAIRRALPSGRWLVVSDAVTHRIAGERLCATLSAAGLQVADLVLEAQDSQKPLVADERKVEELAGRIRGWPEPPSAAIAVGAGTVNDIVKMATCQCAIPYAVVATAPSMNGYTSPIAAILCRGVKTVLEAQVPAAVVADLNILSEAPERMIAAGFGDLLSKPVSNADWLLSHELTGSKYSRDVIRLVDEGNRLLTGKAPLLQARDPEAIGCLTAALILSGYAMALAGTSAPASGGEHLISHYLDMTHYAFGEPNDLHGCQVGVGVRVTASLYERLMGMDMAAIDVDGCVARLAPWPQYEHELRQRFGVLAEAVIPHAHEAYPTPERLRARLMDLKTRWRQVAGRLKPFLRPAAQILADLKAAHCPTTFADIGVNQERARRSVTDSKDVRSRYTILHLCWELGRLDQWADESLPGIW